MSRFRAIEDRDVGATVALWEACGLTRPWNDPYQDICFARSGPSSTVLVLERDGRIVASVMAGHDGHRGTLYYVAVDPACRGQGIGRAAVKAAEAWLAERGVWKVNLLVRNDNAAVRAFYEALGYELGQVLCMARQITGQSNVG
jgi:ribosomal protein S18 acetylase RimI-like enzyme